MQMLFGDDQFTDPRSRIRSTGLERDTNVTLPRLAASSFDTMDARKLHRLLIWLLSALCCPNLLALSDRTIMQYTHTAWGPQQGAPYIVSSITQTTNGELWLGTTTGLYRFDGLTFEHYEDPQSKLPLRESVPAVFALSNGGLWVGYSSGVLARINVNATAATTTDEVVPYGFVQQFVQDQQGTLWAAAIHGLLHLVDGHWKLVGEDWNFPSRHPRAVFVDHKGTLWVSTEDTLVYLPAGTKSFQATGIHVGDVTQITEAPNGKLWMTETNRSVRPVPLGGNLQPTDDTEILLGSQAIHFDREGALWVTTVGDGMRRSIAPQLLRGKISQASTAVEKYTSKDGLTNDVVGCIFEDRDGTIWVGSLTGLDRFRKTSLVPVPTPVAVSFPHLVFDDSGDMWIGSDGRDIIRMHDSVMKSIPGTEGSGHPYSAPSGVTYWPGSTKITVLKHGHFSDIPLPVKPGSSFVNSRIFLTSDREATLWAAVDRQGIFFFRDHRWTLLEATRGFTDSFPMAAFTDSLGRMWFGYYDGSIVFIDNGELHQIASSQDSPVSHVRRFGGNDQHVWVAGDSGVAFFDGTRFRRALLLNEDSNSKFRCATQLTDDSLWLCGLTGALWIAPEEVHLAIRDPAHQMVSRRFDTFDGLPENETSSVTQGPDGRIWFTTIDKIAWTDPSKLSHNTTTPPVVIRSVDANGNLYGPSPDIKLQPRTKTLEITYTALSLAVPERVKFRYRLEGVDRDWQAAGARREVSYSNLGPGYYKFHVTATNDDNLWSGDGATLDFTIPPAWYQTSWFYSLCTCIVLLLLWNLYAFRMRQVARAIGARFDERLAERTRMARELHDTFLQTVQGSKMVADDALDAGSDEERMRHALERLSLWLDQAVTEGRAALHALRISVTERNHLAEYLERAAGDQCRSTSMSVAITVLGDAKDLHPIVRDEIARIGEEAIRNACSHSKGSQLEIELRYADDLHLRFKDNGTGIDPFIIESGKAGHYGLQGMCERANRIGAKLSIRSGLNSGTEVTLRIPGSVVYRTERHTFLDRLKQMLRRPKDVFDRNRIDREER